MTTTTADSTSSPGPQLVNEEDAQSRTSHSGAAAQSTLNAMPVSEGERSHSSERNVFSDVFGDVSGQDGDGPEVEATPRQLSHHQREAESTTRQLSHHQREAESRPRQLSHHQREAEARPRQLSQHTLRRSKRSMENVTDASPVSGLAEMPNIQNPSSMNRIPKQTPQSSDMSSSPTDKSTRRAGRSSEGLVLIGESLLSCTPVASSVPELSKQQDSFQKKQGWLSQASSRTAAMVEGRLEKGALVDAATRDAPLTSTPCLASQSSQVMPTPGTSAGRRSSSISGGQGYSPSISDQLQKAVDGSTSGRKRRATWRQESWLLQDAGEGSSQKNSRSSVVIRLSSFENLGEFCLCMLYHTETALM